MDRSYTLIYVDLARCLSMYFNSTTFQKASGVVSSAVVQSVLDSPRSLTLTGTREELVCNISNLFSNNISVLLLLDYISNQGMLIHFYELIRS